MERIQALIDQLKQQADANAEPSQLLITVQLLQNELAGLQQGRRILGTSKVAVVLPATIKVDLSQYEKYAPKPEEPTPAAPAEPASPKEKVQEVKETVLVDQGAVSIVKENGQLDMVFDPMTEIPTLSQQSKEADKSQGEPESLNDKLKQGKTELLEVLKETPVKDLRKAIGINDRFLFINELFRGDESMYERSIRTINSFNIFPEAEYWINRELKVKLGWQADHPAVLQFDHLVKRRFS